MEKGDISGRFNTLRNRGEEKETGIYWVSKRMGKIRNLMIGLGLGFCLIYGYYWFKSNGEKLKTPCEKAYYQEFEGQVIKTFLEENSQGVVTVLLLNGSDTLEYFTGWGGHKNTGEQIRTGNYLKKQSKSFDLQVTQTQNDNAAVELKATVSKCQ